MSPNQAIAAAAEFPKPDVWEQLQILREVLSALEKEITPKALVRARKKLLDNAEAFRPTDAPGHTTWYQHHLQSAAFACARWEDMTK